MYICIQIVFVKFCLLWLLRLRVTGCWCCSCYCLYTIVLLLLYKNLTHKHIIMWEQAKTYTAARRDENARARLYTLYSLTRRLKTYIFKFHLYELWIGATGIYKRNLIHIDLMYKQQHIEVNMSYTECVWYIYRYSSTTDFAIQRAESAWSIWKQF